MNVRPTKLERTDADHLVIAWSDGQQRIYGVRELREACSCATCRDKRTQSEQEPPPLLPVLAPEEARPLTVAGMEPVGNYAYSIQFSDGHNTGIYTFDYLRALGRPAE